MKRFIAALSSVVIFTACSTVDTTGLSKDTSRTATGNQGAIVLVEEFADLQCPACKSAFEQINGPLLQQYGADIRFEFKHFPLQTMHPYAMAAAEGAECAADQGKFWEYIDLVYTNQVSLNGQAIMNWAKELGLDMDLFTRCAQSHIKRSTILADYKKGQERGVQGTPTFFVNGEKVESTLPSIGAAIEAAKGGAGVKL